MNIQQVVGTQQCEQILGVILNARKSLYCFRSKNTGQHGRHGRVGGIAGRDSTAEPCGLSSKVREVRESDRINFVVIIHESDTGEFVEDDEDDRG